MVKLVNEKRVSAWLNPWLGGRLVFGPAGLCAGSLVALAMSFTCGQADAQSSGSGTVDLQAVPGQAVASSGSGGSSTAAQPVPLSNSGAPVPAGVPNGAVAPAAPPPTTAQPRNPYAKYEWTGINVNLPPPPDTVTGDLFGTRQKLADQYGIGFYGISVDLFYDNVLRHDHSGSQTYVGQKPTSLSENFLLLTYDLSRYGIPDGQIVASASYASSSWNAIGPTGIQVGELTYYQTLLNKRIEIKAGLLSNVFEYLGEFTGGSLAGGAFGASGDQFLNTGGTDSFVPTYGIDMTGHITKNIYDKLGVARGLSPLGLVAEHNYNPTALRFSTPQTGAWVINELGYLRPAEPDAPETWLRGGTVFSGSHYEEFDHPGLTSNSNYFLYLLGDRQLLQTSSKPGQAYRGVYAGFTLEYAPPNLNFFSEYYEARIYGLGLLPHRPFDEATLLLTDTFFSSFQYSALRADNVLAHGDSKAITGSYSFHLLPGFYVDAGVQYVDNPSPLAYARTTGSALNLIGGVAAFF